MKTALVTGVTGQDGAYIAALLLGKGYKVVGGHRRSSSQTFWRLKELGIYGHENFTLVDHDVTDPGASMRVIAAAAPDEIYNLGAQSFVGVSFAEPTTTALITGLGAMQLLEAVRTINPKIRCYQASSSEMFGGTKGGAQDEETPFHPCSPYAVAKLFAHWSAVNYREAYGMFVSSGILFNHESPMRGEDFVTRKITRAVARIALGLQDKVTLGNVDAERDWGFAGEFVEGMWRMLQADAPDTFVLATGDKTKVRDFATSAFVAGGIEVDWSGTGTEEVARNRANGKAVVTIDKALFRPAEVEILLGDASKAERLLGWRTKTTVADLAQMMVAADMKREAK
jgi:GDPmannose 4,6-dehydratase